MELVYAALLLHEAGKEVNEDNLGNVLKGADVEVDSSQIKAAVAALEDVDLDEAMSQPAAAPAAAPADTGGEAQAEEADEEAEAEEEEQADEEAEEAAEEGLGQLF